MLNKLNRRSVLKSVLAAGVASSASKLTTASALPATSDREYWISVLERVSDPVLRALSQRRLSTSMPVEAQPGDAAARKQSTCLEAMGRLLAGIAPFLESPTPVSAEESLRRRYCEWARAGIESGTDPASPDYMHFGRSGQTLVDSAFLALAISRAPTQLWTNLSPAAKRTLIQALKDTRQIKPPESNWLLFSAMVEAGLCLMGEDWQTEPVDYALRQHRAWFLGDGTYGDGPHFHWDYYNSYVIQPLLLAVLEATGKNRSGEWHDFYPIALDRARRYAAIQERLISPEATFPAIGRSLAYRFGAFHHLADTALRRQLPEDVSPAQVRSALTAVMRRMIEATGTFDASGWLTIGFAGHQPAIGEHYISTGSCYLCSFAWLPLGLSPADPFWSAPPQHWTAQKVWSGENLPADHALDA
jgi:hypothetical protein